tara:strand:+ start:1341 stop:1634 length:294 start_codon:yes stop_codon:yes gene_type:complete
MSDEYRIEGSDKVVRLEKRGRGFRRLITAINDLPLYGIIDATHPSLVRELEMLKDKLKTLIAENNQSLTKFYMPEEQVMNSDPLQNEIINEYTKKGT